MLKSFTAFVNEPDDLDAALQSLWEQLDLGGENTLLSNTVGILSCFTEYLDLGLLDALTERLPFPLVGSTTIANGAAGQLGETALALLVITSDDVSFSIGVSDPITVEDRVPIEAMYQSALADLPGNPALILSFSPLLTGFGGDYFVECITDISGGVPNFGTVTVDHNMDYRGSMVIARGQAYADRFAIVLIHGPIEPTFYVGTISDEKVFAEKGVVTASSGNRLEAINGRPAVEYLLSLGLAQNEDGSITGMNSFPVIVDSNDGTQPVVRVMFALTPDGHVVCGGNVPVGSTLTMGRFDSAEIVYTTRRTLSEALQADKARVMLMYSCIGRYFSLGYDPMSELNLVQEYVHHTGTPYICTYSGGEFCPVYNQSHQPVNRNHNSTFIICTF